MNPSQLEHTDHAMVEWCARNGLDATRIPAHGDGALDVREVGEYFIATWREVGDDGTLSLQGRRAVDSMPPTPAHLRPSAAPGAGIGSDVDALLNGRTAIVEALAGYNFGTLPNMAEAIQTDPGPLLAALAEAGVLERDEDALIYYRHGVNSGTLRARNTPESIAAAVRQYEQATHGPAGVERIETRTTFAHTTEWQDTAHDNPTVRPSE